MEAERDRLQEVAKSLADRVVAQSELLSRRAEKVIGLEVDGAPVLADAQHDYALRLGPLPALYKHGRRVTHPWSVRLVWDQLADPHGGNANTDG